MENESNHLNWRKRIVDPADGQRVMIVTEDETYITATYDLDRGKFNGDDLEYYDLDDIRVWIPLDEFLATIP